MPAVKTKKPSAAAKVRAALDPVLPKPSDDVPLQARRRAPVEVARPPPTLRLLSRREVCERLGGISYPTIWKWMREGRFPKARVLNGGKLGWIESEIEEWIRGQPLQTLKPADEEETP
jgi:predicted DNA-binding transcriptional regulator AlpA